MVFSKSVAAIVAALGLAAGFHATQGAAAFDAQVIDRYLSKASLPGPLVIGNDRGGSVGRRADEVSRLNRNGRAVELRGRVCLSSCTMYLGVDQVCVERGTTFGFHGPSYYGTPLSARDFEYWSRIIAKHYPQALAEWYMTKGRHRMSGYHKMKGDALIGLGVDECP